MSSFSCPHFDPANDWCLRLKTDCVPGRAGCVLAGKVTFVVPAEERVRACEEAKKPRLGTGRRDEVPKGYCRTYVVPLASRMISRSLVER